MARRTHDPRAPGYNTTRNPPAPRRSFSRLYSSSPSLASDSRTLLRDRRECLHLSPPAGLRFTGRFAQRAFYSLASSGRAMDAERIPPSSQPCRGRRQNTHKARLVNYSRRDRPHLHPGSLRRRDRRRAFRISQKGKEEKKRRHRMVIAALVCRCDARESLLQRRQPSCNEECSLCCHDRF